jgi:hypothetical protein
MQSVFNAQYGVYGFGNEEGIFMHQNTNGPSFLQPQWNFPVSQSHWPQDIMVNTQSRSSNVRSPFPAATNTRHIATDFRRAPGNYGVVPGDFSKISNGPSTYVVLCKQDMAEDLRKWRESPGWICGPGRYRCLWPGCLASGCFASIDIAIMHMKVEHIQHCLVMTEEYFQQQTRKTEIEGFRWMIKQICENFCSVLSSHVDSGTLEKMRLAAMYASGGLGANPLKLCLIEQGERGYSEYQKQFSDSVGSDQARTALSKDPNRTYISATVDFSGGSNATLFSSVIHPAHYYPKIEKSDLASKIESVQIDNIGLGHTTEAVSHRSINTTGRNIVEDNLIRSTKATLEQVSSVDNPSGKSIS